MESLLAIESRERLIHKPGVKGSLSALKNLTNHLTEQQNQCWCPYLDCLSRSDVFEGVYEDLGPQNFVGIYWSLILVYNSFLKSNHVVNGIANNL